MLVDAPLTITVPFGSTWKYDHYLQTVNGPDETQGFARAAAGYDDSTWASGAGIIGWATAATVATITTTVPTEHEIWMRKTVGAVAGMSLRTKADDFFYIYVNGLLVAPGQSSDSTIANLFRGPFVVPTGYLNLNGQNVIAFHVQDNLAFFGTGDRSMADVEVSVRK